MNETISVLRGHTLRLALLGTGAAMLWATFTLLLGTLSPASADAADAAPPVLTSTTSTLLPGLPVVTAVTALATTVVAEVTEPVEPLAAEVAAPVAQIVLPAVAPLIAPVAAAVAPVLALVEPVLTPVTSVLPQIAAPLTSASIRLVDVAAGVGSPVTIPVAIPGVATVTVHSLESAGPSDSASRPAAASALLIAPTDSPMSPTPSAPATPALLPATSVNAVGGNAPGAASDLPSGRSDTGALSGVLALFGGAVLPSAPTFGPGSTPD